MLCLIYNEYMIKLLRDPKIWLLLILLSSALLLLIPAGNKPEFRYNGGIIAVASGHLSAEKINGIDDIYRALDDLDAYGFSDVQKELILKSETPSSTGTHYRFKQQHEGYDVFGRELVVSVGPGGEMLSVTGNYLKDIHISDKGLSPEKDAADIITQEYRCDYSSAAVEVYSLSGNPMFVYDFITGYDSGSRILLDAVTLNEVAVIPLAAAATTPEHLDLTDHSGQTVTLPVERGGGTYILGDATRNIYTYDYGGYMHNDSPESYVSETGQFEDGYAVTMYKNLISSYDFYADAGNIGVEYLGADNSHDRIHGNAEERGELTVLANLHWMQDYNNAAYSWTDGDRENGIARLLFGDGDGEAYTNFAAAKDTVGHEYQHIVTAFSADLIYSNASGALNEAFSDLFGALIEGKPIESAGFWQCGEDLSLTGSFLRDMRNPSATGYADNMSNKKPFSTPGNTESDNGGVHDNSTIISHAVYNMYRALPAEFTAHRLGTLLFDTLLKLAPGSNFADFRLILVQSATELSFSNAAVNAINSAFDGVGVYASAGTHTVTVMGIDEPRIITADYGETFTLPTDMAAPDNKFIICWADDVYSDVYYAGETYDMPPYDMRLFPAYGYLPWNGTDAVPFEGAGSISDPFLISSAEELASLAYYVNNYRYFETDYYFSDYYIANYKMIADIDLNNVPWMPIGIYESPFSGNFDGNGYKIKNLNIVNLYDGGLSLCGLFGLLTGSVKNVRIESGISATDEYFLTAGAIAGMLGGGSITGCYNKSDILCPAVYCMGGLVGNVYSGDITNSYNAGNVSGKYSGGLIGWIDTDGYDYGKGNAPTVKSFGTLYNTGDVCGEIAGGIAGSAPYTVFVNCINTGKISAPEQTDGVLTRYIGGIAGMLNFNTSSYYETDENAGLIGCRNTGIIDGGNADYSGALAGLLMSDDSSGKTLFEKNIYKAQAGVKAFGYPLSMTPGIIGTAAKESNDNIFEGDFDFDNEDYFSGFSSWGGYGMISIFDSVEWAFSEGKMPECKVPEYWIDYRADKFESGSGTKNDPYVIKTAGQLALLAYKVNTNFEVAPLEWHDYSAYYILGADIDLTGKAWVSIGATTMFLASFGDVGHYNPFQGCFDGNGYKITNMSARFYQTEMSVERQDGEVRNYYINAEAALFGAVSSSYLSDEYVIENVILENVNNFNNYSYSVGGGLIGKIGSWGFVRNCSVTGFVGSDQVAGGLIGNTEYISYVNPLKIENCYADVIVSGAVCGGIIGQISYSAYNKGDDHRVIIKNCVTAGDLILLQYNYFYVRSVGGIVGEIGIYGVNIIDCINAGDIYAYANVVYAGQIVGSASLDGNPLKISGCKGAGAMMSLGQINNMAAAVGYLNIVSPSEAAFLNGIYKSGYEIVVGADSGYSESGNKFSADEIFTGDFDFNNIEYYFDTSIWSDLDADAANDIFEFFGNARINVTIYYVNGNDSIIYQTITRYGVRAAAPYHLRAVKDRSEDYEFTFLQWDYTGVDWKKDTMIYAEFSQTPRIHEIKEEYTIIFKDIDGSVIQSLTAERGRPIIPPELKGYFDGFNFYLFYGWDTVVSDAYSDITYTAVYTKVSAVWTIYIPAGVLLLLVAGVIIFIRIKRKKI